jgi:beta-N-acetylhexosaminidase
VRALTASLQGYAAKVPIFIAVDQEGGAVCRLKEAYGFPATVSARSLGVRDNETATREAGRALAAMVGESGFNLNFAPVVDLDVNPIRLRSGGSTGVSPTTPPSSPRTHAGSSRSTTNSA